MHYYIDTSNKINKIKNFKGTDFRGIDFLV